MTEMKDHIEYIKEWYSQDRSTLTSRQVADAVIRMCDDALSELEAAEQAAVTDRFISFVGTGFLVVLVLSIIVNVIQWVAH